MGVWPHNVELHVLSHRHSQNAPCHKLPACSRWSQAVDPSWRAEKVSAESYTLNSYPLNSCVWRHPFWCNPVGLWRRYRWKRGSSAMHMAYMLWSKCIQNTDTMPDEFPVQSHRHSPTPPPPPHHHHHHHPTTTTTTTHPPHKLPVCGRWSRVVAPRWRVGKIPAEFYRRIVTWWILVCDVSDFGAI